MVWLEDFQKYVMELQKSRPNLILCGDYNICHEPIDIHDPVQMCIRDSSMAKNIAVDYRNPVALFSLEMSNVQ